MNELALFAGAGGGLLGGKLLGWHTKCAVEINPFCTGILVQRQNEGTLPAFPIWDDIRTFDGRPWAGLIDIISGGFPCQAYSTAASGKNNADDMWPEMRRVIADVAPQYVLAENVSRKAINVAGDDLEQMGYKTKAVALSAADLGGDHIRKRYWLLAYSDNDGELRCPIDAKAQMLPELCEGVWSTYPDKSGVDDGVACRMDRLKAIGNGQVPAVAALAWRTLTGE